MTPHHEDVVVTPILNVHDLTEAAAFYAQLGFTIDVFSDDYAFVTSGDRELLHLTTIGTPSGATVYLNVPDADDWHATCVSAGHDPGPIWDRPWGMREFDVTDPSGHTLRIGTNR